MFLPRGSETLSYVRAWPHTAHSTHGVLARVLGWAALSGTWKDSVTARGLPYGSRPRYQTSPRNGRAGVSL
ncbi:hypothetical protein [Streptomyces sp. PSKA30]|uniref:hypothetical protein n=1 Tax=Streptomyces sp. PSKA30 TaxID=2874597 RepID=UPI001CD16F15|nr:hypothetical protein [Streptomyces sp. PSKA30]